MFYTVLKEQIKEQIETHIHDRPEKEELETSERIEVIAKEACNGLEGTDSEKIFQKQTKTSMKERQNMK